ncbi:hypothetical protein Taro_009514 [Colocasia esculenta]|uniref:Uncharacterized protein n=1 Tax=Colocasia esculenta TaxID=4460 RepID=A0A843TWK5_COLES|nr:hypothetical protein [Colocasia esculenta]
MEDDTLVPNDLAVAADEEAAQWQAEIQKLRSDRASLQSELEAAVFKVNTLSAAVEELQGSKASLEAVIADLRTNFSSLQAVKAEEADRVESDRRALEAVAKRAADLEGDVSRLQHDLVVAESDRDEAAAEARRLKESVEKWQGEVSKLEAKLSEANKADDALKLAVERLAGEKNALEEKKGEAEAKIAELGGKVESLEREVERVLEEKEEKLGKVKLELAALEAKVGSYEVKLEKMREVENGNELAVDGGAEQMAGGKGHEEVGMKFPWMMVAASTGAVAAVAAVACYLHHVKSRWGLRVNVAREKLDSPRRDYTYI